MMKKIHCKIITAYWKRNYERNETEMATILIVINYA